MASLTFIGRLLMMPWIVLKTIFLYYTFGTVYSKTNDEFKHSLKKNIIISIESYLARYMSKSDIQIFTYVSLKELLVKFQSKDIVRKSNLPHFGDRFDEYSHWLVNNGPVDTVSNEEKNVLVFYHGGGYAVGLLPNHVLGLIVLYLCLSPSVQEKLSILIVDYSLTIHEKTYPTQIYETTVNYQNLLQAGYKKIFLMGDSAGGNLALAISRYVSYPVEASLEFSKYPEFMFPTIDGPQPEGLILISPWVDPRINTSVDLSPESEHYGDLIGCETDMDKWYVDDVNEFILGWIVFDNTNHKDYWANIKCLNKTDGTLVVVGDRELLHNSIERWVNIVDKNRENICYAVEKGGIHDCIFNVEMLDFKGPDALRKANNYSFNCKFCLHNTVDFLTRRIQGDTLIS